MATTTPRSPATRAACVLLVALALGGCSAHGVLSDSSDPQGTAFWGGHGDAEALGVARAQFQAENYGLAERHYRALVEREPGNAEAWLGLAAAYDQLGRFDLADRAYDSALAIAGRSPEVLNNQGYSHYLRGDRSRARALLDEAHALDPGNPRIAANLALL